MSPSPEMRVTTYSMSRMSGRRELVTIGSGFVFLPFVGKRKQGKEKSDALLVQEIG